MKNHAKQKFSETSGLCPQPTIEGKTKTWNIMNRNEVKLIFDNKDDRDKLVDQYSTDGNEVYNDNACIETEDDIDENKFSMNLQRDNIEDWRRIGQDARLFGANIQTFTEN